MIGRIQDINVAFNDAFMDDVMMPMVKLAVTLMFTVVSLDYSFQLIEAIDIIIAS